MNWSVQVDTKVSETVSPSFLSKFKKRNQFHATFKKRKREKINADSSWQTQSKCDYLVLAVLRDKLTLDNKKKPRITIVEGQVKLDWTME